MGLLLPSDGEFCIDGIKIDELNAMSWQSRIAHVPQAIFLSDSSISENIAFGIPKEEIDTKIKLCAKWHNCQKQLSHGICNMILLLAKGA